MYAAKRTAKAVFSDRQTLFLTIKWYKGGRKQSQRLRVVKLAPPSGRKTGFSAIRRLVKNMLKIAPFGPVKPMTRPRK